ncbi:putative transcription factor bHLH041 [Vigna radiata var. radiata]|uniref:Transcription factor bHLH041 n=1 Tax=Vigna radiata var. radiata TaxID=3916 RepID=A0A3Q0F4U8_VIGRR|nr:putative transcription factor bHLH041 [Vigna radiata var. radiata]
MAVFMGCKAGEIELGFSNIPQDDIETALQNLFPEDFYMRFQSIDQNPYSSSSSSFIISSTNTFNQSLNIPGTSHSNFPEALGVAPTQPTSHQHNIQPLSQVIPFPSHLPTPEGEHEEIVRALIRVLSSTSQQQQLHQVLPHTSVTHPGASDFVRYIPDMTNPNIQPHTETNFRRQNLNNTSLMRERNSTVQATDHISTLQHHFRMISERRRREKLKVSFEALRALLPAETKKSKAMILTTAKERIISLMADIEKLNMRKQQLMKDLSGNESLNVRVWHVPESSSSEEKMVDLEVTVREQSCQVNVSIRIFKFLERIQNLGLISTKTNLHTTEGGTTINVLTFRLGIIEVCIQN